MSSERATQSPGARRPPWRRAAYLIVCNTLLLLLGLELGWRLVLGAPPEPFAPPDKVGYTLHPFMQMANPPRGVVDPGPHFSGWRVDPPHAVTEEGRLRVLFLGGSTTNTDYPAFVRQRLEPELGAITGYNTGADWQTSLHSLYKFWTYVDELHPDLVIVLHNVNDFLRGFTPPRYALPQYRADYSHFSGALNLFWTVGKSRYDGRPVFHARPAGDAEHLDPPDRSASGMLRGLVDGSEVLSALRRATGRGRRTRAPAARGPAGEPRQVPLSEAESLRSLPAFARNMRNLRAGCAVKGVKVLFLTMPFSIEQTNRSFLLPGQLTTNDGVHHMRVEDFAAGMRRFNEEVLALRDEPRAWVLDLAPHITDPAQFQDEVHLVHPALKVEAGLVADFVLANDLLSPRR